MTHPELLAIGILRALVEVAMLTLLGQGLLALLAGAKKQGNPVYRIFCIVTEPVIRIMRRITPRQILDRHLPFVAFVILFWLWIGLAYLRQGISPAA